MPKDYSELIKLKMSKVIFSDYLRQREQVNNGTLLRASLEGGSGTSHQASLVTTYYEGAILGGCSNERCVIDTVATQQYLNSGNVIAPPEDVVPYTGPNFVPDELPGLALWLDGADTATMFSDINGTVAATSDIGMWKDKSPNSVNAVSWSATSKPLISVNNLNNRNTVSFSGLSNPTLAQYFNLSNVNRLPAGTADVTYFFVSRVKGVSPDAPPLPGMVLSYGSNNNVNNGSNTVQLYYSSAFKSINDVRSGTTRTTNGQNTLSNPIIITSIMNASNSGWIFGTPFSEANNLSIVSKNIGTNVGTIGAGLDGTNRAYWFNGNIAEILVYSNALSTSNRLLVEAYLGWKWGLQESLSSDNPYKA